MSTALKILPVGCGDALAIEHRAKDGKCRNILIDGGYMKAFKALKEQIGRIENRKWQIDLWILTHLDADHINGAVKYLREQQRKGQGKLLNKLWFNFFDGFKVDDDSDFLSFAKGFDLTKLLRKLNVKGRQDITSDLKPIKFGDAKLSILSPDQKTFAELKTQWKLEFEKYYGEEPPEYLGDPSARDAMTIEKLAKIKDAKEDESVKGLANRSSVAFIYEENGKRLLMLGDAYASVIVKALSDGPAKKKPLKVKYVKLSHHGSKKNYNSDLLKYIKCRRFIISADGNNQHGIPDKEVLAKILTHPNRDQSKKIIFYFNHDDDRFRQLFDADPDAESIYNFTCKFPKKGKALTVNL